MTTNLQFSLICFYCMLLVLPARAQQQPQQRLDRTYTHQLAVESDALVRDAIRRPYGWAWDSAAAPEPVLRNGRPTTRPVSIGTLGTPAAGLVLLWTGRLLDDARYVHAAEEAARAVSAAQSPNGQVSAHPIFGPSAGGRDEPAIVPEREGTRAGLGLLLALVDLPTLPTTQSSSAEASTIATRNAAVKAAAIRAAVWMGKQESPNGLWVSTYPPNAGPKDAVRIVRLDDTDCRDSSLALILAGDVLADESIRRSATRSIDGLMKLRLTTDAHGPNLWCTAVTVDATDVPKGFPSGPDVLASRYAMQAMLGSYLIGGNRDAGIALDAAATTLGDVKRPDGLYDRFLDPTTAADVARETGSSSQGIFAVAPSTQRALTSVLAVPWTSGSFGVPELVEATARLKPIGRERYVAMLTPGLTSRQHVSATLTGLSDNPLTLDFPLTAAEAPAYIAAHAEQWQLAEAPMPQDLAGRVRRLWVLFLRAKLERLMAMPAN